MLNPDDNLYSVAPVGNIVVIGRQVALKGGITRENAINLLTWLILSTNATPDEIRTAIVKANRPTARFAPSAPPVAVVPRQAVPFAGQNVAAFMGEIDAEEQAALNEVQAACEVAATLTPVVEAPAAPASLAVVPPAPVRTAAPVPTTPARGAGMPIVAPVAVNVPGGPMAAPSPASVAVDPAGVAKAWGVSP